MKITTALMEKMSTARGSLLPMQPATQSKGFEQVLRRSTDTKQDDVEQTQRTHVAQKANNATKAEKTEKTEKPAELPSDDALKTTDGVNESATVKDEAVKEEPKNQDEAMTAIAQILGVSAEALRALLEQLNMNIEDLAKPENLRIFFEAVKEVATPLELLNVPNIAQEMSEVKTIAEAFATYLEAEQPEVVQVATTTEIRPASRFQSDAFTKVESTAAVPEQGEQVTIAAPPQQTEQNTDDTESHDKPQAQIITPNPNIAQQPEEMPIEVDANLAGAQVQFDTNVPRVEAFKAEPIQAAAREVIEQVTERIKVEFRADNTTEIKMTLKPESLGEVSLKIMTNNGIITAQFLAESQRVKEVLESGFNQLRDALNEQGIAVTALSVEVGGEREQNSRMAQFREQQNRVQGRRIRINGTSNHPELVEEEPEKQRDIEAKVDISI